MQSAQTTFISSTFGLKELDGGCTKTLDVMEKEKPWGTKSVGFKCERFSTKP